MPASRFNSLSKALLLTCLVLPGTAFAANEADDADAPTITVTGKNQDQDIGATKTGTRLIDTPQSITTLDRQQIEDRAVAQLNDALRYVPGVIINQGEGHRDQVTLRGQSTTADFYLDGLRDDAQYYRSLYNTERLEVLKGANALLFGRGGGGGVVNRVSKTPEFDRQKLGAALSGDTFGAWSLSGDANLPLSQSAALRLNSTYEEFDSHRDFFTGHFIGFAPTIALRLGEASKITLSYEYAKDQRLTDRGVPSFGGVPVTDFRDTFFGDPIIGQSNVDAHIARIRFDSELADGLSLNASVQYANYDKNYGNVVPGAINAARTTVALTGYRSFNQRENWIGQLNLVWKGETGGIGHTLLTGIEGSDQNTLAARDDLRFGNSATANVTLAQRITVPASTWVALSASNSGVRSLSAWLQDQIELGEHVQLIAGLRFDQFRIAVTDLRTAINTGRKDNSWSPRFGVVIKPQSNLSLYASYAKSFLPQSGDQFATLAANVQTLAPEQFRNLEAGIKWDGPHGLSASGAVYQIDRSNTRANDPNRSGFFVLTGSSRVQGFEAAFSGKILPEWQLSLGMAIQSGELRSTTTAAGAGSKLPQLPHTQFSAWSRYELTKRLGLALGLIHQGSQFATISNAVRVPAFTRLDAAVFYDLSDRIALQLNVENLGNVAYFPSAHTDNNIATGKPLNARFTARLKF